MLKLIVLSAAVACVLAAVLPKPPAAPEQKNDAPAVKSVPLHAEKKPAGGDIHKPVEKPENAKLSEAGKPEQKAAKKEQSSVESSAKKPEEQGRRDNVKQGRRENVKQSAPHNMHSKAKPVEEKKPAQDVKEAVKAEESKVKPSEKGR